MQDNIISEIVKKSSLFINIFYRKNIFVHSYEILKYFKNIFVEHFGRFVYFADIKNKNLIYSPLKEKRQP